MLKDIIPFDRFWLNLHSNSPSAKAITSFIHFIERRLGARFVYDQSQISDEAIDLANLFEIAESLRSNGTIRSYERNIGLCDEPRTIYWQAEYALGDGRYEKAGGSSFDNPSLAFIKMLAEAIERNAWFTYDTFTPSRTATIEEIKKRSDFVHPEKFAAYTDAQRKKNPRLTITPADSFHWVQGYSWTKKMPTWVPTQTVSGSKKFRAYSLSSKEPALRESITTGLATHPVRNTALVSGALEVIERDAYMITWLNQLSLPRIDLTELSSRSESLKKILAICRQYRLEPHAIRLLTDAPTHAICVTLEDLSESLPRFSIGLKAHQNSATAVEGAILEALRAHTAARKWKLSSTNKWNPLTKAADIKHYDRLMYWSEKDRGDKLVFLIKGNITSLKEEIWEADTDEEHFNRITNWCREKNYELVSVNFSDTEANVPKWNIELVIIPDLQPIYFNEKLPQIGGSRLRDIPKQFGYKSREPYCDDPHPFV